MVPSTSLFEILAQIPDPRSRHGRRHPLSAILALAVVAMLSGAKTYVAIAQFGREKGFSLAHALGFLRGKTPTTSTFSIIFRALDVVAFENGLSQWIASRLPEEPQQVFSLDGKTARGSRDGEVPGHHLVSAYCAAAQAVLAQLRVDAKTNEHKAALQLLGILPVKGNIITGDAMFCQRDVCAAISEAGGDYVFTVKDNQPSLVIDIGAGLSYQEQAERLTAAFSPSGSRQYAYRQPDGHHPRQGPRPHGKTHDSNHNDSHQAPTLEGTQTGVPNCAGTDREWSAHRGGRSRDYQPQPRASRCAATAGTDA